MASNSLTTFNTTPNAQNISTDPGPASNPLSGVTKLLGTVSGIQKAFSARDDRAWQEEQRAQQRKQWDRQDLLNSRTDLEQYAIQDAGYLVQDRNLLNDVFATKQSLDDKDVETLQPLLDDAAGKHRIALSAGMTKENAELIFAKQVNDIATTTGRSDIVQDYLAKHKLPGGLNSSYENKQAQDALIADQTVKSFDEQNKHARAVKDDLIKNGIAPEGATENERILAKSNFDAIQLDNARKDAAFALQKFSAESSGSKESSKEARDLAIQTTSNQSRLEVNEVSNKIAQTFSNLQDLAGEDPQKIVQVFEVAKLGAQSLRTAKIARQSDLAQKGLSPEDIDKISKPYDDAISNFNAFTSGDSSTLQAKARALTMLSTNNRMSFEQLRASIPTLAALGLSNSQVLAASDPSYQQKVTQGLNDFSIAYDKMDMGQKTKINVYLSKMFKSQSSIETANQFIDMASAIDPESPLKSSVKSEISSWKTNKDLGQAEIKVAQGNYKEAAHLIGPYLVAANKQLGPTTKLNDNSLEGLSLLLSGSNGHDASYRYDRRWVKAFQEDDSPQGAQAAIGYTLTGTKAVQSLMNTFQNRLQIKTAPNGMVYWAPKPVIDMSLPVIGQPSHPLPGRIEERDVRLANNANMILNATTDVYVNVVAKRSGQAMSAAQFSQLITTGKVPDMVPGGKEEVGKAKQTNVEFTNQINMFKNALSNMTDTASSSIEQSLQKGASNSFNDNISSVVKAESGGRNIKNQEGTSSASGYFQMIDSTWKKHAKAAGVDTNKYPTAMSAPKELQIRAMENLTASNRRDAANKNISWTPITKYAYHHFGPGEAPRILKADPLELMANVVSRKTFDANRTELAGKTVGDMLSKWAREHK